MALLPYMWDDPDLLFRPSKILDQQFGLVLDPEDLLQPFTVPSILTKSPAGYLRNWRPLGADLDAGSTVAFDKDKFQANLDVSQFKPEEISVKVTGENTVTVEGKQEEKEDEHGHIYRHFVRRYVVPKACDVGKVESKLSSDGVLTLTAPRVPQKAIKQKAVPVKQTGKPSKGLRFRGDSKKGGEKKCDKK